ncbi:GNAT family N-acetyltransferase [Nocardioides sp. ChNu-99]|uniref:GNAT family N-acetyltransferase n=1 Tax=Nocardioides sp. ChNu-99 TaxID=2839897 RepID=UPI0024070169|nr:GNAT family N-acetyltransferase [Nocardioides sp. ChNu-99]MDF9714831.1 GNAT family N-acetyltransferase [Nocardioides sp. ChNu-99]
MSAGEPPALRIARPADVSRLVALEAALFGVDAWSADLVAEELTGPGRTVVVAAPPAGGPGTPSAGPVVGYAVLGVAGDVADLLRIGVAPEARRTGVATALLAAVLDVARQAGAERLLLEVAAGNAGAVAFYAHAGFAEIHRRPRYYRDGSDALVLQREL